MPDPFPPAVPLPPLPPPQRSNSLRWVLGCLGGLVLIAILTCGGLALLGYWGYQVGKDYLETVQTCGANIRNQGAVATLHAEAQRATPFDPVRPPALTVERVETWLAIRREMQPALAGVRGEAAMAGGTTPQAQDLGQFIRFLKAWSAIKLEHGRLLVKHGMSNEEYQRIGRLAFGALLQGGVKLPEAMQESAGADAAATALLQPHLAELKQGEGFGLDVWLLTNDFGRFEPKKQSGGFDLDDD